MCPHKKELQTKSLKNIDNLKTKELESHKNNEQKGKVGTTRLPLPEVLKK